ncbi:MAG: undecaprenyl-phosphate galactose phosphotransferase WbaP [Haemophilus parainfluenzae]|nr:undecaprenyl-phosphate galactose phosphotransferase WbaP [Haemophilus parainfluenzae]
MNRANFIKFFQISIDFFSFGISIFLSSFFLLEISGGDYRYFPLEQLSSFILIHCIMGSCCVIWFWIRLRHYTYRKPFWFELKEIFRTLLIIFVIELAIVAFSRLYVSRYFWSVTWLLVFTLVPFGRVLTKNLLIKLGWYLKETIIIGNGKNAKEVFDALNNEPYLGFNIKLFINTEEYKSEFIEGVPVMRHNPELLTKLVSPEFTQFILAIDEENKVKQDFWLRYLIRKGCRSISVIPDFRGIPLYGTDMSFLFSHEMVLFRVNNNLAKRSSRFIKRVFDILGASFLILFLFPLCIPLYFLIKKDGGKLIYEHSRIGQNKKEFKCLKFRTMVNNSDEVLERILATDESARLEWEKDFKLKDDPRITPIGRWLRARSLDELPQLWNVLKGEMSLVGPRPIVKEELPYYQEDVDYYLMAKPGMTGLWQVSGRNNVSYDTRVYFDTWYAKNWSLWNDIVILFKTLKVVWKKAGAY